MWLGISLKTSGCRRGDNEKNAGVGLNLSTHDGSRGVGVLTEHDPVLLFMDVEAFVKGSDLFVCRFYVDGLKDVCLCLRSLYWGLRWNVSSVQS